MSTTASPSARHTSRRRPALHLMLLAVLLGSMAVLPSAPALADGIIVTTNADSSGSPACSLRDAIIAANTDAAAGGTAAGSGADTITFAGDYTITLASALPQLAGTLTIDGAGHSVTISGNNGVRVFYIQGWAVVTLNQLSIINGLATNGGGIYNGGTLTVSNSTLSGNWARGRATP